MSAVALPTRYDAEAIKQQCSIAEVVAARVGQLVPSGSHSYKALCPFHDDRNPSLLVDETDGHFHCFACKARGDVIDFVRRVDGLSFAEACERLTGLQPKHGERASASVAVRQATNRFHANLDTTVRHWDRLRLEEQAVMNLAQAVYRYVLRRTPEALAYLRARSIPERVVNECGIGYADGRSLETHLRRRGILDVARQIGLLKETGHGKNLREFFAGRIVIPELRGDQCIWMIGRTPRDAAGRPKYLALGGERPVLGWERAAGREEVYLCEGVVDYLTAVSWDLPAFSPCGTSLPDERLGFLARARVVWGVLDGDDAGRAAAERFGRQLGHRWHPLRLPDGQDLNDLGRQEGGAERFASLVGEARAQL
jgi:DNA primase